MMWDKEFFDAESYKLRQVRLQRKSARLEGRIAGGRKKSSRTLTTSQVGKIGRLWDEGRSHGEIADYIEECYNNARKKRRGG